MTEHKSVSQWRYKSNPSVRGGGEKRLEHGLVVLMPILLATNCIGRRFVKVHSTFSTKLSTIHNLNHK